MSTTVSRGFCHCNELLWRPMVRARIPLPLLALMAQRGRDLVARYIDSLVPTLDRHVPPCHCCCCCSSLHRSISCRYHLVPHCRHRLFPFQPSVWAIDSSPRDQLAGFGRTAEFHRQQREKVCVRNERELRATTKQRFKDARLFSTFQSGCTTRCVQRDIDVPRDV
jgi:hypothetical protein